MKNMAELKTGIVAVSRDCFPVELSRNRLTNVLTECGALGMKISGLETIIENEKHVLAALDEMKTKGINTLVIYLGNFGPEGPTSLLAQRFPGPVMLAAAAEETATNLISGRGDAYCGMLNVSYNLGLRHLRPYIPEYPVGLPAEIAAKINDFLPVARVILGLRKLKIFSFGPRPQDFLACNAPVKALYDLGMEIMENSELDLYDIYRSAAGNPRIESIAMEMAAELGSGNTYPALLKKLAQYEVALTSFMEANLGASEFGVFANKCWPAFEKYFEFVPCYVNSRLAAMGIPVSCEVDIYGVLSEYIAACATQKPATLLDINNTVPPDMYAEIKKIHSGYKADDLFMGFHCGNTPAACLVDKQIKYQLIMHRLMEAEKEPEITRGTLEGQIMPGPVTVFRLQSAADTKLRAYVAEGEVLNVAPKSFGGIGVIAVKEMARFYRHVLIEKRFPHHAGIAFKHAGKFLFPVLKMLGIEDISYNLPAGLLYASENPFQQTV